jgi:hypothetical protein
MADFNYDEYDSRFDDSYAGQPGLMGKARRWINIGGAVCSVSLVVGLAWWGYQLAVRDVTGVPVMRAVAGAMRIAPADPGGEQALNQGLTVNTIAAMGASAAPADEITLAPQSVALAPDDAPLADATAADPAASTASDQVGSDEAAADQSGTDAAVAAAVAEAPAPVVPDNGDPNVVRVSMRPQPRPSSLGSQASVDKPAPDKVQALSSQPGGVAELDPAKIPAGTRLAQLGAFETPALAREKFAELVAASGDLMAGKDMVVQSAQSGGRTFYRLRAHGFVSDDDTRRFCAALQAAQTDCIPVAQR